MKKKFRRLRIMLILAIILAIICADSRWSLDVTEYTVADTKIPVEFNGWRIVQLSDLHLMSFGENNTQLIAAVRNAKPDLIAITGDLVDTAQGWEDYVRTLMAGLKDIAPVYYISGNHEWAAGCARRLFKELESCGVTVLRNEYEIIEHNGASIVLAGADDPNGPSDMISPAELYRRIEAGHPGLYAVLLAHRNTELESYAQAGFDLTFCGHAHGGVVRLPGTDGLINTQRELFPTHTSGLYDVDGMTAIVSRGLGNNLSVPRFLNRPHIPVAVLAHKQ